MEIDGYCEELQMGFEYQGKQHLEFIPHWHKRKQRFLEQQKNDNLKKEILEDKGVVMLYPTYQLKPMDFEQYILEIVS
jgi:hypothetical protein